jgi:hypothetical protein
VQRIRHIILLLSLALLSACSNTFVYNQLDWLIPWYLDDYVDLTREQRRDLKVEIREVLRWHRSEELAGYMVILDGIEADLQQPVTAATVENWANQAVAAYERLEERTLPMLFDLGRDLSDEQMAGFIANLERAQHELEEEYLERSDEEYITDAREGLDDNLRDFMGRLTPEQREIIANAAASLQRFDFAWLEERRQWLATLSELLQREPGWEDAILEALRTRDQNRTEAYISIYNHNGRIINQTIAEVLNLRTEKQDARLLREIEDFRRDLRKLIAQAEPEAES